MNEEHLKAESKFSIFSVKKKKNAFWTKNHEFLELINTSSLFLGYPGFHKKILKRFCNKLILKTRVKVNVYPLCLPTRFHVATNFRGNRVLMHVLKICEKEIY